MSSTNRTVRIFGRSVHWRQGVTDIIIFWIYVYVYFLPSGLHVSRLRRVDMLFSSLFSACCPAHRPPTLFVFYLLYLRRHRLYAFLSHSCNDQPMPYFYTPLNGLFFLSPSVMFSSSCHVANLAYHLHARFTSLVLSFSREDRGSLSIIDRDLPDRSR